MAVIKAKYTASAALTITLASLGSSATFVAGREATAIDNSSNLFVDVLLTGKVTVGTTPTINTQVLVYVFGAQDETPNWPGAMTGSDAARTLTSVGVGNGYLRLAAVLDVDSTTSDRAYTFGPVSIAQLFGGVMPRNWGVYVTHNTGVNLNSTGGNHYVKYQGVHYEAV